jgi:hypothetical protein
MYATASATRIKAARRLTKRALRERERSFLAEGPQAVSEALATGARVTGLFVTGPAEAKHADLVGAAEDAGIEVQMVSGEVMGELAQTITQRRPPQPGGGARQRQGPGQRGHRAAHRRRGGRGRRHLRRRLG